MLFRYDPQNDPFQDLNDPAVLDGTPIGTLRVVPWANVASVAIVDEVDPTIVKRIIYTLHENENPLNAIYGKRPNEATAWREIYDRRDASDARTEANEENARSKDFVGDLDKIERRYDDGKEAVAAYLGLVPLEVKG